MPVALLRHAASWRRRSSTAPPPVSSAAASASRWAVMHGSSWIARSGSPTRRRATSLACSSSAAPLAFTWRSVPQAAAGADRSTSCSRSEPNVRAVRQVRPEIWTGISSTIQRGHRLPPNGQLSGFLRDGGRCRRVDTVGRRHSEIRGRAEGPQRLHWVRRTKPGDKDRCRPARRRTPTIL